MCAAFLPSLFLSFSYIVLCVSGNYAVFSPLSDSVYSDVTVPLQTDGERGNLAPCTALPFFVEEWVASFTGWTVDHQRIALDALISV